MKLYEIVALHSALDEIAKACAQSPKDFPVLVKLMAAENLRLAAPHVEDFHKLQIDLLKQNGATEKDGQVSLVESADGYKSFLAEFTKLREQDANTKFRRIYESDLGSAPVTINQLVVLQQCGVVIPNETK